MNFSIIILLSIIISNVELKTSRIELAEIKMHINNYNCGSQGQSTICKPVTPPCFVCTTPPYSSQPKCSNPPVTFKFECPTSCCKTVNPCKPCEESSRTPAPTLPRHCCRYRTCNAKSQLPLNSTPKSSNILYGVESK